MHVFATVKAWDLSWDEAQPNPLLTHLKQGNSQKTTL